MYLLEGLLRDGRLTLKQMIDRASQGKGKFFIFLKCMCPVEHCFAYISSENACFKQQNSTWFNHN